MDDTTATPIATGEGEALDDSGWDPGWDATLGMLGMTIEGAIRGNGRVRVRFVVHVNVSPEPERYSILFAAGEDVSFTPTHVTSLQRAGIHARRRVYGVYGEEERPLSFYLAAIDWVQVTWPQRSAR